MNLPLEPHLKIGFHNVHPPDQGTVPPDVEVTKRLLDLFDRYGVDSVWVGDHISFAAPILDPIVQLSQVAALNTRITIGVGVFLLALRHPAPVAKAASTLDILSRGRLIFGVGAGGEFAGEFALCGVPVEERGARISEGVSVLRKLWSGAPVSHEGRFFSFPEAMMAPAPYTEGGPPIWFGGRSDAALRRAGAMGDGWISYVVTPEMYVQALAKIADATETRTRHLGKFGTGHLLFARLGESRETALDFATKTLSKRYAMDFRKAADRYCALGTGEAIAERIREFYDAGVRHIVIDLLATSDERHDHIAWFGVEVMPLLADLRGA